MAGEQRGRGKAAERRSAQRGKRKDEIGRVKLDAHMGVEHVRIQKMEEEKKGEEGRRRLTGRDLRRMSEKKGVDESCWKVGPVRLYP